MKRFLAIMLLFAACGGGTKKPAPAVEFGWNAKSVYSIKLHGVEFSVGGLYAIGSYTGADNPNSNADSRNGDGAHLGVPVAPSSGNPFKLVVTKKGDNAILVNMTIGPLVRDMATLSAPLDLNKGLFTSFLFSKVGFWQGCISTQYVAAAGGLFASIPTPCTIDFLHPPIEKLGLARRGVGVFYGKVGYAESRSPIAWMEASGPSGHVRLTILPGSTIKNALFYHHPATNNEELNFGALKAGQTAVLNEELYVY